MGWFGVFECVEHCGLSDECEKFRNSVNNNPVIRPVTEEAWERCQNSGLGPDELRITFLTDYEFKNVMEQNSNLIEIVTPYLDHLEMNLSDIPYILTLSDKDGWVIDIRGDLEDFGGKKAGVHLGASWSERAIGNNGIGTAIQLEKPVLVYGREHFVSALKKYTSIGVPIKNNGQVIGVISIRVPNEYGHQSKLQLIISCVNSIESSIANVKTNLFTVSDEMKLSATSELIATLVHDLKNPLSVIRGLGELGKLSSDDNRINSYFSRIIKKTDQMNSLIVELLDVFKPQEFRPMNANRVIREVLEGFSPTIRSKNIILDFIVNCNENIYISESLFKRAIENLITNSIQIIDDGGLIEIKIESEKKYMLISIRDTAGGIPESIRENIFEPFSYSRRGGTGLGLFMVYHTITTTHRGQVWFETKTGVGSTFFIKLPIHKEN